MEDKFLAAVAETLSKKEEKWYHTGTDKFVYQYNKRLGNYGNYVEK